MFKMKRYTIKERNGNEVKIFVTPLVELVEVRLNRGPLVVLQGCGLFLYVYDGTGGEKALRRPPYFNPEGLEKFTNVLRAIKEHTDIVLPETVVQIRSELDVV